VLFSRFRNFEIGQTLMFWRQIQILTNIEITDFWPKLNEKLHSGKIWLKIRKDHVFLRKVMYFKEKKRWNMSLQNCAESKYCSFWFCSNKPYLHESLAKSTFYIWKWSSKKALLYRFWNFEIGGILTFWRQFQIFINIEIIVFLPILNEK